MLPEEARRADTRAWLEKARRDLRSAAHALEAVDPLRDDAVFHCQQAVEKAFKLFLTWHDIPFRKTHSLEELGRQYAAVDSTLEAVASDSAPLSEYAWRFRYPGPADAPTPDETSRALQLAARAVAEVSVRLPAEVVPPS
jgi:HEPN domain-containing protein